MGSASLSLKNSTICNLSSRVGGVRGHPRAARFPNTPSTCSIGTETRKGKPTKICLEFRHSDLRLNFLTRKIYKIKKSDNYNFSCILSPLPF